MPPKTSPEVLELLYAIRELAKAIETSTNRLEKQADDHSSLQRESLDKLEGIVRGNRERLNEVSVELGEHLREIIGSELGLKVAQKIIDSIRQGMFVAVNGQLPPSWAKAVADQNAGRDTASHPIVDTAIERKDDTFSFKIKKDGGVDLHADNKVRVAVYTLLMALGGTLAIALKNLIGFLSAGH